MADIRSALVSHSLVDFKMRSNSYALGRTSGLQTTFASSATAKESRLDALPDNPIDILDVRRATQDNIGHSSLKIAIVQNPSKDFLLVEDVRSQSSAPVSRG